MWYCLIILLLAGALSFLLTPVTKIIASKYGAIDHPDGYRKTHKKDTPRLGGLSIVFAFTVLSLFGSFIVSREINYNIIILCLCAALVCVLGTIDDIISLPAWIKVLFEIIIATIATLWGGAIEYVFVFGSAIKFGAWGIVITILWYFIVMNSINLIDGLDGLATLVTIIISLSILVMAILKDNTEIIILATALIGSLIGFFPHNIQKNNIFMGDSGSLTIGFILAGMSIFGMFKGIVFISAFTPAVVFALPLFDMISVFAQRTVNGQNPFKADRRHIHHKLVDLGFSNTGAVVLIVIVTVLFAVASIVSLYDRLIAVIITVVLFIILILLKHAKDWFGVTVNKKVDE